MKTLSKIVIATAGVTGIVLAAAAFAHGPAPGYGSGYGHGMWNMGPYGGGMAHGMHDMHGMYRGAGGPGPCLGAETMGARLDALQSELNLTAEQIPAWNAFEDAVRTQVQAMADAHPNWSQNEEEHITFMEQRLEGMKAVQKAKNDLYDVLTAGQKAAIDRHGFRGPRV